MNKLIIAILISVAVSSVTANQPTSYVAQGTKEIKALSKSEIEGYLSGKGMGYAKAAELNHFPGPRHVLDLSEQISLTNEQKIRTQNLFDSMKNKSIIWGGKLIKKEKELDQLFAKGTVTDSELETLLTDIGALQSKLRYVHLKQKGILNVQEIRLYDQLRGYQASNEHHGSYRNHSH